MIIHVTTHQQVDVDPMGLFGLLAETQAGLFGSLPSGGIDWSAPVHSDCAHDDYAVLQMARGRLNPTGLLDLWTGRYIADSSSRALIGMVQPWWQQTESMWILSIRLIPGQAGARFYRAALGKETRPEWTIWTPATAQSYMAQSLVFCQGAVEC